MHVFNVSVNMGICDKVIMQSLGLQRVTYDCVIEQQFKTNTENGEGNGKLL